MSEEAVEYYIKGYVEGRFSVREAIKQGLINENDIGLIPEELKRENNIGSEEQTTKENSSLVETSEFNTTIQEETVIKDNTSTDTRIVSNANSTTISTDTGITSIESNTSLR